MSLLTKALERILKWLEEYRPYDVSFLQPGLSKNEIEIITEGLPFKLPHEVYELYQWKNGTSQGDEYWEFGLFFDSWSFKPLNLVVNEYLSQHYQYRHHYIYDNQYFFPVNNRYTLPIFFGNVTCDAGYTIIDKYKENSYVYFINYKGGGCEILARYISLTNMMLTIADCYEAGAYYVYETTYRMYANACQNYQTDPDPKFVKETIDKIYWKYNFGVKNLAVAELESQFHDGSLTDESLAFLEDDLIKFKPPSAVALLIKILQSLEEYPISLEEVSIKERIAKILGYIGDAQAIDPLITVLQDDFWQTRYSAALSLALLKDKKAIQPLSQLIFDENEDVRYAANMAIKQLSDGA
ncbi:PBS lyase HEAT-like repeat [Rivularia sp. IAM M-261]|nr:PBS lyase HEAT-like repeat [Calothrix sp. PCC 7716]GJD19556.1 PBS lyase HEAT-like repeat [Rivularia sp. IAM M-261]